MKMIIFNCPAYKGLTRDIPDWLDNTNCGHYAGQVPCQDCTDCLLKQIVEYCKTTRDVYCYGQKHNIRWIDANNILKKLDIQECE